MTEINLLYDPNGPEKAKREEDARLAEALGISAIGLDSWGSRQRETIQRAGEGLRHYADQIGPEALKTTAELIGINLDE